MGVAQEGAVAQDLGKCEGGAEDGQDNDKGRFAPDDCCHPVGGQLRAKLKGCGLEDEQRGEKTGMTPQQAGKLETDDGTKKLVRLKALVAAEGVEGDSSRVDDQRSELDSVRLIGQHG